MNKETWKLLRDVMVRMLNNQCAIMEELHADVKDWSQTLDMIQQLEDSEDE